MIKTCASPIYGNMASGDIVVCDVRFAQHLVDEIGAAEYLDALATDVPASDEPPSDEPPSDEPPSDEPPGDGDLSSTDEPAADDVPPAAPRKKK